MALAFPLSASATSSESYQQQLDAAIDYLTNYEQVSYTAYGKLVHKYTFNSRAQLEETAAQVVALGGPEEYEAYVIEQTDALMARAAQSSRIPPVPMQTRDVVYHTIPRSNGMHHVYSEGYRTAVFDYGGAVKPSTSYFALTNYDISVYNNSMNAIFNKSFSAELLSQYPLFVFTHDPDTVVVTQDYCSSTMATYAVSYEIKMEMKDDTGGYLPWGTRYLTMYESGITTFAS